MDNNSEQCSKILKRFSPSLPMKGFVYVSMVAFVIPYIIPSSWFIKTPCVSCTVMNAIGSYPETFSKLGQSCAGPDVALTPFITARKKAGSPGQSRSPKGDRLAGSSSPELHVGKPRHASEPSSSQGSQQSLSGVDGDIKQAFGEHDRTGTRNLRNDLLHAADSVTSAMSSLVQELNSVISELELHRAKLCRSTDYNNVTYFLPKDVEDNLNFTEKNGIVEDPELKKLELEVNKMTESLELDKRIRHKASENLTNGDVTNSGAAAVIVHAPYKKPKHQTDSFDSLPWGGHVTDDESYIQTDDDEGNIRTDEEELEWQESMKRWANR